MHHFGILFTHYIPPFADINLLMLWLPISTVGSIYHVETGGLEGKKTDEQLNPAE